LTHLSFLCKYQIGYDAGAFENSFTKGNFMLIDRASKHTKRVLNEIFLHFHERKYNQIEKELIAEIEATVIKGKTTSSKVIEMIAIYSDFNNLYMEWVKEKNINEQKERCAINSGEHHNLLIAHCSDPSSMDDLMWEVINYLENSTPSNKHEVEYQLACYKNSLL
jgi:hypothetical protein